MEYIVACDSLVYSFFFFFEEYFAFYIYCQFNSWDSVTEIDEKQDKPSVFVFTYTCTYTPEILRRCTQIRIRVGLSDLPKTKKLKN